MAEPAAAPIAAPVAMPAPAATPSPAAPTPTPATPATVESPASVTAPAVAEPTTTEIAPAEAPGKPTRSDFDDSPDGIKKFLEATYAWEEQNPDGTELVTPDEVPVEPDIEPPTAEPSDPAGAEEPTAAVEAPSPEGLSKLIEGNDARKAFLEADPEFKGALYAMGRQNEKAKPILEIFPNVEAAKFANTNANEFVSLKTAITLSDSPEKMAEASKMFLEQFKVVDEKGAPVLDAAGNETYADDLDMFTSDITNRRINATLADLRDKIAADNFATEEGKENAEQALAALEFATAFMNGDQSELDKPDTSSMSPEMKAYFERKEAEITAEREKLGLKEKTLTAKDKAATRTKYDTQYREQFGSSTGTFLANYLEQQEKDGVVIPRYLLTMKDPKTEISVFAQQAYQRLNAKLAGMADVKAHSASLQMNALNDDGLKARISFGQQQIDQHLPGIIDDILREAGVALKADAGQKIAGRDARRTDARVEPASGSPVTPVGLTDKQLMDKAKSNVLTSAKGAYMAQDELMRRTLIERDRLEAQR